MERTPHEGLSAKPIATMKLSTEAIVAAAVAVVFAVLTLGAIAREEGALGSSSTNMSALSQVAALGFDSSSSGRPVGIDKSQLLAQY
jgi:hypothetical protein